MVRFWRRTPAASTRWWVAAGAGDQVAVVGLPLMVTHDSTVDLRRLEEICVEYGVARLEVFGSVSRGDARPGSDIDVLYELAPGTRLGWKIEDLADELSAVLGRPVDLISRRALHAQLRESVLREARVLYAA